MRAISTDYRIVATLVHTGQHYDSEMSDVFFRELDIPGEVVNLGVGSGTHAQQTGAVMIGLEGVMRHARPDIVLTVGDVNSTLGAGLVAAKAGIPQAHVEAGLRSCDPTMPEEINRVVVDRLADLLFTHSEEADENLVREGVPTDRIHRVGNVMIDTLVRLRTRWQGAAADALGSLPKEYGLVTIHRASNVDHPEVLRDLMAALTLVAKRLPLIFPVHPRTRARLDAGDLPGIRMVEPLGYLPFLDLVEHSRLVITDSGGIQEETTMLGVPCLTIRNSTERPVTIRLGTNRLVGADHAGIQRAVEDVLGEPPKAVVAPPLWDGRAAERIVAIISDWLGASPHLRLACR